MAGYCSAADVARYNLARGTYTASSRPNASQVNLFIEDIAGEIDAELRKVGYVVPIPTTASSAFQFLRGVNAVGAAWRVEVASETSDNEGMYQTMYKSALRMMDSVELDAVKDSTQALVRHGFGISESQQPYFGLASQATRTEF